MKKIVSTIALCCLGASSALAQQGDDDLANTIIPYAGGVVYGHGASRDGGYLTGFYASVSHPRLKFELDAVYAGASYNTGAPDLSQGNFTAAVTHYVRQGLAVRAGANVIRSSDDLTDEGYVAFGGAKIFDGSQWHFGGDYYYSHYGRYTPNDLELNQITLEAGVGAGNFYQGGAYYLTIKGNYIMPRAAASFGLEESYTSVDADLSYSIPYWRFEVGGRLGEQALPVRNGGFVVLNINDVHEEEARAAVTRYVTDDWFVKLSYALEWMVESGATESVKKHTGVVSVGGSF